jgi:DNA polymerase-2
VHGIVDSLWLKKEGAKPKDYAELAGTVSREIGVPLSVEGRYRWIVFLPSKNHAGVPVLNRYFGVYDSGKIKIRGIEARKSDTPKFIHDAQMGMIKALARAHNSKEFREKIPQALDVLRDYAKRLVEGKIPTEDLMIEKRLSFGPSDYAHDVLQAIAARQLTKEGVEISAGQSVQYIIMDSENKHPFRRVKAAQLLNKQVHYDTEKYLELLLASAANILGQFCCTTDDLYDTIRRQKQKLLSNN